MEGNVKYFQNLWKTNVSNLEKQCKTWEKICMSNEIPDEVHDEIRATIGLAKLLVNQKLKQFKGLVDDSVSEEKAISNSDLQGFWDMVYFQVEKLNENFLRLNKCKKNDWKFVEENPERPVQKKVSVVKDSTKKNESTKSHALAAKQRLADAKQKMLAQRRQQQEDNFIEILQSDKGGLSLNQNLQCDETLSKDTFKKLKSLDAHEESAVSINTKTNELNDVPKQTIIEQKSCKVSAQNKENLLPSDDTSTKAKSPMSGKSKKKGREVVKLQCVTRSAKRAMLLQQSAMQKT